MNIELANWRSFFHYPLISFNLVNIPEDFIKRTPQLKSTSYNYTEGIRHGCEFIDSITVLGIL
ncbi:hypothetical protein [Neobacillus vireti]|uniref:hypothetical protein n=1 Tax=Neobacillus vireti TaxID=220686 RepID=UPI002FFF1462